jgi:nucleotide-binding universal stress UspA family protein
MTYAKVVVGTDGSPTAEDAVRHAARLAACFDARLVIVTAFQPSGDVLSAEAVGVPADVRWALTDRQQAEEHARHGRTLAHDLGARDVVVSSDAGDPVEVILDTAADHGADLIVVGSRGMTSAARFVLGSVANAVTHHAPCDVLVVHTAD